MKVKEVVAVWGGELTTVTISKAGDTISPGCSHNSWKYNYKYIFKYKCKYNLLSALLSLPSAFSNFWAVGGDSELNAPLLSSEGIWLSFWILILILILNFDSELNALLLSSARVLGCIHRYKLLIVTVDMSECYSSSVSPTKHSIPQTFIQSDDWKNLLTVFLLHKEILGKSLANPCFRPLVGVI